MATGKEMKEKLKQVFIAMMLLVLAVTCIPAGNIRAALTNIKNSKILTADETYHYDIDGDGKDESIYFTNTYSEKNGVSLTRIKLYINDKEVLLKQLEGKAAVVKLTNLNQKDKYIEFEITVTGMSDIIEFLGFYRYKNDKFIEMFSQNGTKAYQGFWLSRYADIRTGNSNTFYIKADSPLYISSIGSYFAYMPFRIKNDKITAKKVKNYEMFSPSVKASSIHTTKAMQFKASRNLTVYTKASKSSKKAFTIKKGEKLTMEKMQPASTKEGKESAFVYVKAGKRTGWMYFNNAKYDFEKPDFDETPGWG